MSQVDENAPFQKNWMENKFRFFVGQFLSFSSHVSRHKAIALDFWDIADVQAFCHIWGKICNESSQSHREAATFLIKKFNICKIPVNSMFQTSTTLNM